MQLKKWYFRTMTTPLLTLCMVIFVTYTASDIFNFARDLKQRDLALNDLVDVADLAYRQKNRDLLASTLHLALTNLGAKQISMCEGQSVMIGLPNQTSLCTPQTSIFTSFVVSKKAPSSETMTFQFEFSRARQWISLFIYMAFAAILSGFLILFHRHQRIQLNSHILNPLAQPESSKSEILEIRQILAQKEKLNAFRLQSAIDKVAGQVAHDIRSPLTGLNMIISQVPELAEEKRILLRAVSNRISDIANQLLLSSRPSSTEEDLPQNQNNLMSSELIPSLADMLVSEKRFQYKHKPNIQIESQLQDSYGAFAKINSKDLQRALSNLIDNSVESIQNNQGRIIVSVKNYGHRILVSVRDNGPGNSALIHKPLENGAYTNNNDRQLWDPEKGVAQAKSTIETFGGKFRIDTRENIGTEIQMDLPASETPPWFVSEIALGQKKYIVALDDDPNILNLWRQRFAEVLGNDLQLVLFNNERDFKTWVQKHGEFTSQTRFLIDYELLGSKQTGLDLITELKISAQSHLVTSRFEDGEIRRACAKIALGIIPKAMAIYVPLAIQD